MTTPIGAASILWAAWAISWMIAAIWSSRAVVRQSAVQRLLQLGLLVLGTRLLFGRFASSSLAGAPLVPLPQWASWAAVALVAAGCGYAWWARIHLGRLWSGTVTLKADHALVQTGPYRVTRHPIYTGLLLALLATAVMQNELAALAGVAVIVVSLQFKIRDEERLLTGRFGALYDEYRATVPALIPRPWRRAGLGAS